MILATGASYRRLGIPSLEELTGAGVFYGGPASEAPALTGKDVYVVGGGNSAGQAALHLARYARRVTLLVRSVSLDAGMSHYLVRAVEAAPNVEVRTGTTIVGGGGEGHLEQLVLRDGAPARTTRRGRRPVRPDRRPPADRLAAAGDRAGRARLPARPATTPGRGLAAGAPPALARDEHPGVFAAGDVRHGSVKRVAAAVGEGAVAVQLVHRLVAEGHVQPAPAAQTARTA